MIESIGQQLLRIMYTRVRPKIHTRAAELVTSMEPRVLLDIGSANALLASALMDKGYMPQVYVALDPDPVLLTHAEPGIALERVMGVAESLPLRSYSVDLSVFHDSLHHLNDPDKALEEAARVSECILVDDIDPDSLPGRLVALLERLVGFPARFIDASTLVEKLEERGLRVIVVRKTRRLPTYRILACR
ncbi:class I SAM-dependent methyltransferase [Pyrodictium delaneyi]|uniref:Methyltransferase type 11 domain-containing protein n=1 Tax=Pyrodictium delaneyi TaxID=1273541 RepID=A0A211YR56_9CREN|nr:class I SAM-dependent methyltransferase [Pyrodictium delaneyi]OWJ55490.1 hypothetical protein Pdsh_01455 [Pyrodictium delaneyi]